VELMLLRKTWKVIDLLNFEPSLLLVG